MGEGTSRRGILGQMLALSASLPLFGPEKLLAEPASDYVGRYVQPDLRAAARAILDAADRTPPLSLKTLAARRAEMAPRMPISLPGIPIEARRIRGSVGQPDVTIYVINAKAGMSRPGILSTHGGGFVLGTAAGDNPSLQKLCKALDCVVVNVDYRLAPEARYRDSVEDNYAGLKWLHTHAEALGVDPHRIAVMGSSAGGGHAALLAITARDRGEVPLIFQCLIYPMLDDRTGATRSVAPRMGRIIWTAQDNRFGWRSFLGVEPGSARVPHGAVPARVDNLKGLPPAFIGVGTLDLFLDEDITFAQRLNAAGVPTELIVVPGAFHGFDGIVGTRTADWFNATKLDALRRGLGIA